MNSEKLNTLLRRARAGDRVACEGLLVEVREWARNQASRQLDRNLRSKLDADDVVQSVERDVFRAMPSLSFGRAAEFLSYMRHALNNKVVDKAQYWRASRRNVRRETSIHDSNQDSGSRGVVLVAPDTEPALHAERVERDRIVDQEIDRLGEPDRTVMRFYQERLSDAAIGKQLGLKGDQVRHIRKRAFQQLRSRLRGQFDTNQRKK